MSEREQIVARLSELQAKQEAATEWGAAVGAREEEIRSLESRLLRIDAMTAGNQPSSSGCGKPLGWNDPDLPPPVKRGNQREYVLAVYRESSKKIYSFACSYLNALPLQYEDACPKGAGCEGRGCDDGCPTTGWFWLTGEGDEAGTYQSLDMKPGDRIMGWRDLPQWGDAAQGAVGCGDPSCKDPNCTYGQDEPVSYRWRQPGNKHWIYDPTPEWIEDHKHEIELEPLYAVTPSPGARAWTPDQFWEYVSGLAGEFEAGQMRDMLAAKGLVLSSVTHAERHER